MADSEQRSQQWFCIFHCFQDVIDGLVNPLYDGSLLPKCPKCLELPNVAKKGNVLV